MRRMDKMTNDKIVGAIRNACFSKCKSCVLYGKDQRCKGEDEESCISSVVKWLNEPLPEKSLYQTITSDEDLMRLMEEFKKTCEAHPSCEQCELNGSGEGLDGYTSDCFGFFLLQKVPGDE